MRRLPLIIAIVGAAAFLDHKSSTRTGRGDSGLTAVRNSLIKRMLASMPEDSPPRLIMSVLPRLQAQNEKILALLEEQNDLLRRLGGGQERE